jgi:uncharacterized protein (DUF305 family)
VADQDVALEAADEAEDLDGGYEDDDYDDDAVEAPSRPARSRRFYIIAGAVGAVVLLLLGFLAGQWAPILTAPGDDSAEAGFARDMSTHHRQAIDMAMIEYDRGQDSTLRRMGYDIATSQQYQVGVMEGWLKEWRLPLTSDRDPMAWVPGGKEMLQPDGRMPGLASRDEMARLQAASGKDADILFCQLMLRHHLGGIHMIDAVLQVSDNDRVRELAEQMRQSQQGEIAALQELLKSLGAQPL